MVMEKLRVCFSVLYLVIHYTSIISLLWCGYYHQIWGDVCIKLLCCNYVTITPPSSVHLVMCSSQLITNSIGIVSYCM